MFVIPDTRIKALAASWARADHELANALLRLRDSYGVVEVLKALTILDSGRRARIIEKRIKMLQCQDHKVSNKKMGKLKSDLDNLNALKPKVIICIRDIYSYSCENSW